MAGGPRAQEQRKGPRRRKTPVTSFLQLGDSTAWPCDYPGRLSLPHIAFCNSLTGRHSEHWASDRNLWAANCLGFSGERYVAQRAEPRTRRGCCQSIARCYRRRGGCRSCTPRARTAPFGLPFSVRCWRHGGCRGCGRQRRKPPRWSRAPQVDESPETAALVGRQPETGTPQVPAQRPSPSSRDRRRQHRHESGAEIGQAHEQERRGCAEDPGR